MKAELQLNGKCLSAKYGELTVAVGKLSILGLR